MNNRGIRSFGALFIVLLFLMGAWAVHPVGSAQAQGKKIQGIVQEDRNPTAPISATVTLTDVHSLATYNDTTAGDQHTFDFTPSPGFYSLKVHATGYFDNGTTDTFRFDGTQLLTFIFNMTKWDTRNKTLTVLVTEATGANWDEYPYFPRFTVGVENAVVNYSDTPTPRTTLKNKPLVRLGNLWWRDLNKGGGQMAIPPSEYSPIDQWAGTVGISNTTILSALTGTPPERRGQYFLNFTQYVYTYTVAQLNHTPVIPGSYTVYKNGVPWMSRENADWKIDVNVGTVTILGNFIWGTDTLNMTWTSTGAIRGATVSIYNTTRNELITSATTDMFGNAQFAIWPGTWNVSASNTDHETKFQTSVYIGDTKTIRIMLPRSVKVIGFVTDSNSWIKSGVAAFLYNIDPSTPIERKVLKASVDAPQFTFKAYPGTFKLIVDANGYASRISDLTIRPSQNVSLGIITLDFSKEEKVDTAMIFAKSNWNNLTIYRNYSFNRDSIIPGLNPSDLRDAFLQIDYTLGNRNGVLDVPTEIDLFKSWWLNNGPATVDTTGLLATNSLVYLSNRTNGSAPAKADTEFIVNTDSSATYPIIIRDKAYYYARDIPPTIPWLKPLYYLNFTGAWDTNVTTYHNNTYVIDLPHGYQMTDTNYKSPGLDIKNFTRMDLDPGLGTGTAPRAEMVVKISERDRQGQGQGARWLLPGAELEQGQLHGHCDGGIQHHLLRRPEL